jgi:hypothetical protein
MDSQEHVGVGPDLGDSAIRHGVFMAWVVPPIAMSGVDLLVFELDATAPVKHVAQARCFLSPDPLYFFTPARLKKLIKVQRYANINVARDESKSGVTSKVKAPRLNAYLMYRCTPSTGVISSPVCASCVCNEDKVCTFG